MKFLVDENLPPRLAVWLCEHGHDAIHIERAALVATSDRDIAAFATANDRVIVTKDGDFEAYDVRVLRLAVGNVRTAALLSWLDPRLQAGVKALAAGALKTILT